MLGRIITKIYRTFLENKVIGRWYILLIDMFIVLLATLFSYILTLQIYKNIDTVKHPDLLEYIGITLSINFIFFLFFKTYKGIIRYSTINEFQRILFALLSSDICIFLGLYLFVGPSGSVSVAYCSTLFLSSLIGLLSFRFIVVFFYKNLSMYFGSQPFIPVYIWRVNEDNIALSQILGIGKNNFRVKGFVDKIKTNNPKLRKLASLPILEIDTPQDLVKHSIRGILVTSEDVLKEDATYIEEILKLNIPVYIVQHININNVSQLSKVTHNIRPIQIEDLLGRPEINISMDAIANNLNNKTVLITGAAGSIGSEIVRQIANFNPKAIICFDQAETPLHELTLDLKKNYPKLNPILIIGSIRDKQKLSYIFRTYKPDIIYHAAAYKHVPLMENDPAEAIITNVLGTKLLVDLAIDHSVEMFVMVSTDKAVNPTNVMGATKRLAEIYVQSSALDSTKNISNTKFVTTRFGNVLGSNGSVIPLFRKQIERGGPLTVTHKDITRYFMTIPEACRLVLEASVIGNSGYIYVFDMGKPVKIYDLAKRMIELAGLIPEKDIKIEFSGLRPGEKLYEELLNDSEVSEPTVHKKIMVAKVREYTFDEIASQIEKIIEIAIIGDKFEAIKLVKQLIPEYISNNSEFTILDVKPDASETIKT